MYGTLALSHRALDDLAEAAGRDTIDELRRMARPLEGLRVLNLSVTGFGTGTAELLTSSVPLLNDLGLDVHWQVVRASEDAAAVSRAMYQALGGSPVQWTHEMTDTWLRYASMNADLLTEAFDVIVVHDPQPLAIRSYSATNQAARWIAHSHLDLSSAQDDVWMLLREHVEKYDAAIFDAPTFARGDISIPTHIVPPAIDPNSPRNMPLPDDLVRSVLEQYGINPDRPLICQVTPCDAACDLVGVYETWRLVQERHPDVQLLIVLFTEPQDSNARACFDELVRLSLADPDAFVVTPGNEIGNVEINVFQTAASVVLQKGLRKGYGMWISDALWKRRPCVVAPAPGLQEQVIHGKTGAVARTTEEFAAEVSRLLENRDLAAEYGENGRRHVAERFLITRYLRDYLSILDQLHRKSDG
ncbi:MAG TPA: glycosyltransferase [Dehalococcoidia bacterium]|nr:glycosyltransferase [Dehalococcoidia bacterium]